MDAMQRFPWDPPLEQMAEVNQRSADVGAENSPIKVVRLVGPLDSLEVDLPRSRKGSAEDWSHLIDRIRDAANHTREVEAQSQEQELRVQQLLDRAREDLKAAAERVRGADVRVVEMQARSETLLKAADERVKAAEERARIAEDWMARVYETIASEFAIEQDMKQIA